MKPPISSLETDVCIVGTGPAGLSLARELAKSGVRICLLESGSHRQEVAVAELNVGEVNSPHGYRTETLTGGRRRQLGGSANLWNHELRGSGSRMIRYVPLDEIDFEPRDWIPSSGWPFSRRELMPFYERANQVCGIGPFTWSAEDWRTESSSQPWQTPNMESVVSQFGRAGVFLKEHPLALSRISNVTLFQRSVFLSFKTDAQRPHEISSVEVAREDGSRFTVKARQVVLAAGGIENARILLLNEATRNGGPGNQYDLVGRYFMDHPSITLGTIMPFSSDIYDRATFYDQHDVQGVPIMGKLHLRQEVRQREKLLNACAVLVPHFKNFRRNLAPVIRQIAAKGPGFLLRRSYPEKSPESAAPPPPGTELSLRQRLLEGYYSERFCGWSRLAGKARRFGDIGVRSLVEQSPDPANRIVLGDTVDRLGQHRVKLFWRWNELDLRSIRRTQEIFREEFAAAGIGAFKPTAESPGEAPRLFFSPHHFMGTTRMHDDPRQGVVDANGRVHGLQNLFVTGGSIFPTGGFANPTLTIVALALKLSDHLTGLLAG